MCEVMRGVLREVDGSMPELAAHLYSQFGRYLGSRVIDAGAGVGLYSSLLLEHGKSVVALEGDSELIPALRARLEEQGGEAYQADLAALAGLPHFAPADSAICINVAEHIEDDRQTLLNIRRRVRPGGRLVILVPAHPWLYNRMDSAIGHVRRYTRRRLLRVLRESGWTPERISYFNCFSIPAWFIAGTLFRRDAPGSSLIRIAGRVMPLMNWADQHLARGRAGISLVAVARNAESAEPIDAGSALTPAVRHQA